VTAYFCHCRRRVSFSRLAIAIHEVAVRALIGEQCKREEGNSTTRPSLALEATPCLGSITHHIPPIADNEPAIPPQSSD
ncbi:unnamed protein product, partial [Nesidiocoris tenuis]